MDDHIFGKIVKKKLVERNMTQKTLAEWLQIDPVTLNRYIKGERRVPEPTLNRIAEIFEMQPQQLLGTDDPDVLIWHYQRLEGAGIDIDEGLRQALVQGRDKSFIYPILRKYYSKGEMQDLVDSYDLAGKTSKEVWPQDNTPKSDFELKKNAEKQSSFSNPVQMNLVAPESLFEGASTEEKKELLLIYFDKLKEIVGIMSR